MASADIPKGGPSRRLDSWKEIADYIRRDVRTATRWESQGLPLHRVAGLKGRSVFAFTHEIDAWLVGRSPEPAVESAGVQNTPAGDPAPSPRGSRRMFVIGVTCGLVAVAAATVTMSGGVKAGLDLASAEVTVSSTQVTVADAFGVSRVLHRFSPGAVPLERRPRRIEDLDNDGAPDLLATVSYSDTDAGRASGPGEMLNLSMDGDVQWRFAFGDAIRFAGGPMSGPWTISDYQVAPGPSPKRVAVAAHDSMWWASVVTILDAHGRRQGAFVNAGWLESVLWRSTDRLAVAGFNNDRDGGTLALLDAGRIDGRSPGGEGTEFACVSCASQPPLFYAVFPRSELNQVTASRFNRATVSAVGDRLVVTTTEIPREVADATAIYEFDAHLVFLRARYSDSYWDVHQRLEREGRLTHTRENCPHRDGPPAIDVWDAARGWIRTTSVDGR